MRSLSLDPLYFAPGQAIDPSTLGLVTTGTLVEWTAEQNVVFNTAAAKGSRLIVSQTSGSLPGKQLRDTTDGDAGNTPTPLWQAEPRLRNRKIIGKAPTNVYGTVGDEVPITTGQFTLMLVAKGGYILTMGYNPAGGNVPFGLRLTQDDAPPGNGALLLALGQAGVGGNGEVVTTFQSKHYSTIGTHVLVVTGTASVGGVVAHDQRYQPARYTLSAAFAASTQGDMANTAKPIRLNAAGSNAFFGYLRIANVAYTEAQCIAWRDYLMQYWTGSVVQP